MRLVDDIRDTGRARVLAGRIASLCDSGRAYRFVSACGGHAAYPEVLAEYLPDAVTLVSGPNCPVCALPAHRTVAVREIAVSRGVVVAAYADMTVQPHAVAGVKRVHSPLDALTIARHNPELRVVFWAAGFEDTAPSTAVAVIRAAAEGARNFAVVCDHLRLPALLHPHTDADGFVVPGQVSSVIGCVAYGGLGRPVVVAGPEPLDVLQAVSLLLQQLRDGRAEVENASRSAQWVPNRVALRAFEQVLVPGEGAGVRIRSQFAAYDGVTVRSADPVL
jgi:hydrogenase expression/formation protein HypD